MTPTDTNPTHHHQPTYPSTAGFRAAVGVDVVDGRRAHGAVDALARRHQGSQVRTSIDHLGIYMYIYMLVGHIYTCVFVYVYIVSVCMCAVDALARRQVRRWMDVWMDGCLCVCRMEGCVVCIHRVLMYIYTHTFESCLATSGTHTPSKHTLTNQHTHKPPPKPQAPAPVQVLHALHGPGRLHRHRGGLAEVNDGQSKTTDRRGCSGGDGSCRGLCYV